MVLLSSALSLILLGAAYALPVAKSRSQIKSVSLKHHRSRNASDAAASRARARSVGSSGKSTPATNQLSFYSINAVVGDQTFDLMFDTGSSNIWVGANTPYIPSSTSQNTTDLTAVIYNSVQKFNGFEFTDTISVGSATVTSQLFGVATSASGFGANDFINGAIDGVFGVGPEGLTSGTVQGLSLVPTYPQELASEGQITSNIVSFSFEPESGADTNDVNGEIIFGDVDTTKFTGDITFIPQSTTSPFSMFWGVDASSAAFGSTPITSAFSAIIDTTNPFILLPDDAFNNLLSATGATLDSTLGVASFSTKPTDNLTFTFAGASFSLTPDQYLIDQAEATLLGLPEGEFFSWISGSGPAFPEGSSFPVLGLAFLESFYTVLDTDNTQIGFAPRA